VVTAVKLIDFAAASLSAIALTIARAAGSISTLRPRLGAAAGAAGGACWAVAASGDSANAAVTRPSAILIGYSPSTRRR